MTFPTLQHQLDFDLVQLVTDFPPIWRHAHKQAIYDRVRREGCPVAGTMRYTRWRLAPLPNDSVLHPCGVEAQSGFFTYTNSTPGTWHLNFADPRLFAAYGSPLMAQDEWQVLEHPSLASLRESLLHAELPALTCENGVSTPVLVSNVPRQCGIDLSGGIPSEQSSPISWWRSLFGTRHASTSAPLYGNGFAAATLADVLRTVTVLNPPSPSNILAIAAPTGTGTYSLKQITAVLQTALSGFSAALLESARHSIMAPDVIIHTGWWGCGAFGGNRTLMALLQILAARIAGIGRLIFHIGSESDRHHFSAALSYLDLVTAHGTITNVLSEINSLQFHWGQSDGN